MPGKGPVLRKCVLNAWMERCVCAEYSRNVACFRLVGLPYTEVRVAASVVEDQWCITFGLESDLASHVVSLLASGLFSGAVLGAWRGEFGIPICRCFLKFARGWPMLL